MDGNSSAYPVKRGDSFPPLRAQLRDGRGRPIVIDPDAGDTVFWLMRPAPGQLGPSYSEEVDVEDGPRGKVAVYWNPDTTTSLAGLFRGEFEVRRGAGGTLTVPTEGYIHVEVLADVA